MRTQTRDTSTYGYPYDSGLLRVALPLSKRLIWLFGIWTTVPVHGNPASRAARAVLAPNVIFYSQEIQQFAVGSVQQIVCHLWVVTVQKSDSAPSLILKARLRCPT